eukprot:Clim_evm9s51 gene=Clim_evmTU9s51
MSVWVSGFADFLVPAKDVGMDGGYRKVEMWDDGRVEFVDPERVSSMDPECARGVPDMIRLPQLHEGALLHNVNVRYMRDEIYTYTGSILVAMNPYKRLPIYDQDYVRKYKGQRLGFRPPHLFAIANEAFTLLERTQDSQCVVISGESGAGKTESTKLILKYLAATNRSRSNVIEQIIESNPILEAFGNAKTLRNNNSSRFGKYMELWYDESGTMRGARITEYLLELSRVSSAQEGERSYHVFYQVLQGPPALLEDLGLADVKGFNYLHNKTEDQTPGIDDREDLVGLDRAFQVMGLASETKRRLFRLVAAVLHIGNVHYESKFVSGADSAVVMDMMPIKRAARLLEVSDNDVLEVLTVKRSAIRGEVIKTPLNKQSAIDTRDALAKAIYNNLFSWIVKWINTVIDTEGVRSIGVLDIFGFEHFKHNSFEQLCINFANENLQFFFNLYIFKLEQEEYKLENIPVEFIAFQDNQHVLDAISKKPSGILRLLDEQTNLPSGNDANFLSKIQTTHANTEAIVKQRIRSEKFGIHHYAGDVMYDVAGFVDKNQNPTRETMVDLLCSSKCELMTQLFRENPEVQAMLATNKAPAKRSTVGNTFRVSLEKLIKKMSECTPHFVRCIKPNEQKAAHMIEPEIVMNQLKYSGMLETIKIRRMGYPTRVDLATFAERYQILAGVAASDVSERCWNIITSVTQRSRKDSMDEFIVGKYRVFMKEYAGRMINDFLSKKLYHDVVLIQKIWRGYSVRKRFYARMNCVRIVQRTFVCWFYRRQLVQRRDAARAIQGWWRGLAYRRAFLKWKHEQVLRKALAAERLNTLRTMLAAERDRIERLNEIDEQWRLGESYPTEKDIVPPEVQLPKGLALTLAGSGGSDNEVPDVRSIYIEDYSEFVESNAYAPFRERFKVPVDFDPVRYHFVRYSFAFWNTPDLPGFINGMLKQPLTILPEKLSQLALDCFSAIQVYTRDFSLTPAQRRLLANWTIQQALDYKNLRDEIYSQLVNQLWKNDDIMIVRNLWQMMLLCLRSFPPSDTLFWYLLTFIDDQALTNFGKSCHDLMMRIAQIGPRKNPPAMVEHHLSMDGKAAAVFELHFPDQKKVSMKIDGCVTGRNLTETGCTVRDVQNTDGWGICAILGSEVAYYLDDGDRILDVVYEFENLDIDKHALYLYKDVDEILGVFPPPNTDMSKIEMRKKVTSEIAKPEEAALEFIQQAVGAMEQDTAASIEFNRGLAPPIPHVVPPTPDAALLEGNPMDIHDAPTSAPPVPPPRTQVAAAEQPVDGNDNPIPPPRPPKRNPFMGMDIDGPKTQTSKENLEDRIRGGIDDEHGTEDKKEETKAREASEKTETAEKFATGPRGPQIRRGKGRGLMAELKSSRRKRPETSVDVSKEVALETARREQRYRQRPKEGETVYQDLGALLTQKQESSTAKLNIPVRKKADTPLDSELSTSGQKAGMKRVSSRTSMMDLMFESSEPVKVDVEPVAGAEPTRKDSESTVEGLDSKTRIVEENQVPVARAQTAYPSAKPTHKARKLAPGEVRVIPDEYADLHELTEEQLEKRIAEYNEQQRRMHQMKEHGVELSTAGDAKIEFNQMAFLDGDGSKGTLRREPPPAMVNSVYDLPDNKPARRRSKHQSEMLRVRSQIAIAKGLSRSPSQATMRGVPQLSPNMSSAASTVEFGENHMLRPDYRPGWTADPDALDEVLEGLDMWVYTDRAFLAAPGLAYPVPRPWQFFLRKQYFLPGEDQQEMSVSTLRLIYAQIHLDLYQNKASLLFDQERDLLNEHLNKYPGVDMTPLSCPKEVIIEIIGLCRSFSLYFSSFNRITVLPSGEVYYLAIGEVGLKMCAIRKGTKRVIGTHDWIDVGEITVEKNVMELHVAEAVLRFKGNVAHIHELLLKYHQRFRTSARHYVCHTDFDMDDQMLLNLKRGDLIEANRMASAQGWMYGKPLKQERSGWFDLKYVVPLAGDPTPVRVAKALQNAEREQKRMHTILAGSREGGKLTQASVDRATRRSEGIALPRSNAGRHSVDPMASGRKSRRKRAPIPNESSFIAGRLNAKKKRRERHKRQAFSFVEFGIRHFRSMHVCDKRMKPIGKEISLDGLSNERLATIVQFTEYPIKDSLLKFMDKDKTIRTSAVITFTEIMKFMGDYPTKRSDYETFLTVLKIGHQNKALPDEVYCQLMKQLTNNRSSAPSAPAKGWSMLAMMTMYLVPTVALEPYLVAFLRRYSEEDIGEFYQTARAAERNLLAILRLGGRRILVNLPEFTANMRGKFAKVVKVHNNVGESAVVDVNGVSTVEQILVQCGKYFGVPAEYLNNFGLFVATGKDITTPLDPEEYLMDINTALEFQGLSYELQFRRCYYYQPWRSISAAFDNIEFPDNREAFLDGRLVLLDGAPQDFRRQMQRLAALLYAVQPFGDPFKFTPSDLKQVFPLRWMNISIQHMETEEKKKWTVKLLRGFLKHWNELVEKGIDKRACKREFLQILSRWPLFGSNLFHCFSTNVADFDGTATLALNPKGAVLIANSTKHVLQTYKMAQILSVRRVVIKKQVKVYVDIRVGDLYSKSILRVETSRSNELMNAVKNYVLEYMDAQDESGENSPRDVSFPSAGDQDHHYETVRPTKPLGRTAKKFRASNASLASVESFTGETKGKGGRDQEFNASDMALYHTREGLSVMEDRGSKSMDLLTTDYGRSQESDLAISPRTKKKFFKQRSDPDASSFDGLFDNRKLVSPVDTVAAVEDAARKSSKAIRKAEKAARTQHGKLSKEEAMVRLEADDAFGKQEDVSQDPLLLALRSEDSRKEKESRAKRDTLSPSKQKAGAPTEGLAADLSKSNTAVAPARRKKKEVTGLAADLMTSDTAVAPTRRKKKT